MLLEFAKNYHNRILDFFHEHHQQSLVSNVQMHTAVARKGNNHGKVAAKPPKKKKWQREDNINP